MDNVQLQQAGVIGRFGSRQTTFASHLQACVMQGVAVCMWLFSKADVVASVHIQMQVSSCYCTQMQILEPKKLHETNAYTSASANPGDSQYGSYWETLDFKCELRNLLTNYVERCKVTSLPCCQAKHPMLQLLLSTHTVVISIIVV